MSKSMPHLVILLPGIMGSALQKDGKDLWALSGQALWQHLHTLGKRIGELNIQGDDWQRNDLGDGVRAVRLIEDLHSIPPLVEHAGYSVIRKGISDFFGLKEGSVEQPEESASFFTFPYDWRRDNRAASAQAPGIHPDAITALEGVERRKERTGHPDRAQHGRPGLALLSGGAGRLAGLLRGHHRWLPAPGRDRRARHAEQRVQEDEHQLRFAHQPGAVLALHLPIAATYPAVEVEGRYVRPAETDAIPNIDPQDGESGPGRVPGCHPPVQPMGNVTATRTMSRRLIPWVGTRQDTLQSASVKDGKLDLSYDGPPGLDAALVDGDGTVPRVSAVPADLDGKRFERFAVERHGWLTNNPMTLQPLLDTLLQIRSPGAPTFFGVGEEEVLPASINLRPDRLFLPDEPVSIQMSLVDAGEQPQGIEISVKPVGHAGEGAAKTIQASSAGPAKVEFGGLTPDFTR